MASRHPRSVALPAPRSPAIDVQTNPAITRWDGENNVAARAIWARIEAALVSLRAQKRHAVRILDLGCGTGERLLQTVLRARELGFTAIEARGVDSSQRAIRDANRLAEAIHDPATELVFECGDLATALAPEEDGDCTLVLWLDGALNQIPRERREEIVAQVCRVTGYRIIATVRSAGSLPALYETRLDQAHAFHQDHARDCLEIDLVDGRHLTLPSHLFCARELRALFAPYSKVRELRGLDIFHARFAADPHWNPSETLDAGMLHRLDRLERLCAEDPVLMDSAAQLLLVAAPKHEPRG